MGEKKRRKRRKQFVRDVAVQAIGSVLGVGTLALLALILGFIQTPTPTKSFWSLAVTIGIFALMGFLLSPLWLEDVQEFFGSETRAERVLGRVAAVLSVIGVIAVAALLIWSLWQAYQYQLQQTPMITGSQGPPTP